jgi:hypothetical protein
VIDGIRTLALRPKPIGVLIPCRLGIGLQCLPRDRLSCPVGQGRERQRALLASLLREIDPCQGCRPITPPSAAARDRLGFLRWGVPEVPIHPECLLPGLLGHPFDCEGARRTRVDHQRAQALDLTA